MIDRETATRIATAINVIRPEWPIASIVTLIGQRHQHRIAADVAAALAWVAIDPDSRTPGRIDEAGPWWPSAVGRAQPPQPPRIRPGEFRATDPAPADRRANLIAQARANLRKDPQ